MIKTSFQLDFPSLWHIAVVYSTALDFTSKVVHYLPPSLKGSKMPLLDNIRASARHHYADRCRAKMLGTQTGDNANCISPPGDHLQPYSYKWAVWLGHYCEVSLCPVSTCDKRFFFMGVPMPILRFANFTDIWCCYSYGLEIFKFLCSRFTHTGVKGVCVLTHRCVVLWFLAVIGPVQKIPSKRVMQKQVSRS